MSKKRKKEIEHAEIVEIFAARLRELRRTRGMTQAEVAEQAQVTISYVWRLESGAVAPGIDLVDRLAKALGTTIADLLPSAAPPDNLKSLQEQARKLFGELLGNADRETLQMLVPLLARLNESPTRHR